MRRRLLCTDLDRTVIPNGVQPESPRARALFRRIAQRQELTLVYVTGRHRELIQQAIVEYDLPLPAYAIGDVGSSIYEVLPDGWKRCSRWHRQLEEAWPIENVEDLRDRLASLAGLTLQESEKQNRFKISFYTRADAYSRPFQAMVQRCVEQCLLDANLIWSIDHATGRGLLDILPAKANKRTAIFHLMDHLGFESCNTVFAGDSGNDLDVFQSSLPGVLVANADAELTHWARQSGSSQLYVASGRLNDLNGNYCAGILEGLCHYWPEVDDWIKQSSEQ